MADASCREQVKTLNSTNYSEMSVSNPQKEEIRNISDRDNNSFLHKTVELQQKELEKFQSSLQDLSNLVGLKINNLSEQIKLRQEDCSSIAKRIQNENEEKQVQSEFLERKLTILSERNQDLEIKNSELETKIDKLEEDNKLISAEIEIKGKQVSQLETDKQDWQKELEDSKSLLVKTTQKLEFSSAQLEKIEKQLTEEKSLSENIKTENEHFKLQLEEHKTENINLQNSYYAEFKSVSDRISQLEAEKQILQHETEQASTLLEDLQQEKADIQAKLIQSETAHNKLQKDFEQVTTHLHNELGVTTKIIDRYKSRVSLSKLQVVFCTALISALSIGIFNLVKSSVNYDSISTQSQKLEVRSQK
jgi:golgin subfamily B member 1